MNGQVEWMKSCEWKANKLGLGPTDCLLAWLWVSCIIYTESLSFMVKTVTVSVLVRARYFEKERKSDFLRNLFLFFTIFLLVFLVLLLAFTFSLGNNRYLLHLCGCVCACKYMVEWWQNEKTYDVWLTPYQL